MIINNFFFQPSTPKDQAQQSPATAPNGGTYGVSGFEGQVAATNQAPGNRNIKTAIV
jgi:hypothetical protein